LLLQNAVPAIIFLIQNLQIITS